MAITATISEAQNDYYKASAERKHRICIQMDGPVQGASE